MFFNLDDEDTNTVVINIIDYTVVCSNMSRIGNITTAYQSFRMPKSCTRMFANIMKQY